MQRGSATLMHHDVSGKRGIQKQKQILSGQGKKTVLRAKRFQKRSDGKIFLNILLPKLPPKKLKNHEFLLLASLAIFYSNFCPKKQLILPFFCVKKKEKKISANGKKAVSRVHRTVFFFLALALT